MGSNPAVPTSTTAADQGKRPGRRSWWPSGRLIEVAARYGVGSAEALRLTFLARHGIPIAVPGVVSTRAMPGTLSGHEDYPHIKHVRMFYGGL